MGKTIRRNSREFGKQVKQSPTKKNKNIDKLKGLSSDMVFVLDESEFNWYDDE